MAWRSAAMGAAGAPLAALLAAIIAASAASAPTQEPVQFEAAFQGRYLDIYTYMHIWDTVVRVAVLNPKGGRTVSLLGYPRVENDGEDGRELVGGTI